MSTKKVSFGSRPRKPAADTATPEAAVDTWVQGTVEPEQDPEVSMKRLTIDLPEDLHRELKIHAARQGVKMADLVRDWVRQGVNKESS